MILDNYLFTSVYSLSNIFICMFYYMHVLLYMYLGMNAEYMFNVHVILKLHLIGLFYE